MGLVLVDQIGPELECHLMNVAALNHEMILHKESKHLKGA